MASIFSRTKPQRHKEILFYHEKHEQIQISAQSIAIFPISFSFIFVPSREIFSMKSIFLAQNRKDTKIRHLLVENHDLD